MIDIIGCQGHRCPCKITCYRYVISKSDIKLSGLKYDVCNSFMTIFQGQELQAKSVEEDRLFEEVIKNYG